MARLGVGADGQVLTADSSQASGLKWAAGGSSGGVKNFITNGDADNATASIFSAYQDAAANRPVDGLGGTPTVTTSLTTTNPLTGTKSFLLTKPASTFRAGLGRTVSVELGYFSKPLKISIRYILNSGTFSSGTSTTDGDVIWYLFDVTNSQLIEPSNIKMYSNSTTTPEVYEASFQTSSTGTSYRLIAHVASATTSAFELKIDDVTVTPQVYVYTPIYKEWQSYTPTGSFTTNTTYTGRWRRVGQNMEVQARVSFSGAPNATSLNNLTIPVGYNIDTTVNALSQVVGYGVAVDATVNSYPTTVLINSTTSVLVTAINASVTYGTNNVASNTIPFSFGSGDLIDVLFSVPIVGWGATEQTLETASTEVSCRYITTAGSSIPNTGENLVTFGTRIFDPNVIYNTSTGTATITSSMRIRVTSNVWYASATYAAGNGAYLAIYKNGSAYSYGPISAPSAAVTMQISSSIDDVVDCVAGDTIQIRARNGRTAGATNLDTSSLANYLVITKVK